MSDDLRARLAAFYAAIDSGDLDTIDDLTVAGFAAHIPGIPVPLDRAGVKGLFAGFRAAFPDLAHHIESCLTDGVQAATRITITGTHQAPFNGIPATGKPIALNAINLFRFDGDRIAEQWIAYDTLAVLQQLGVAA